MAPAPAKLLKIVLIVLIAAGFYLLADYKHADRETLRQATVELTQSCSTKLRGYALHAGESYRSPYMLRTTGDGSALRGYTEEDVRAIQRGCNIIDDTQGQSGGRRPRRTLERDPLHPRHSHQLRSLPSGRGRQAGRSGNRLEGSNGLAPRG